MKRNGVYVNTKDLYQFLIAECRYGYRRNNHLMPWGAYEHVKTYLNKMLKVDLDSALHTASQLCEECISDQLMTNFSDGLDDEHGNRKEAIEFIRYLIEFLTNNAKCDDDKINNLPYNYPSFQENLKKEASLKYHIVKLESFNREIANVIEDFTKDKPLSKIDADKLLFNILGTKSFTCNFIHIKTKDSYPERIIGEVFRIIEPVEHKDEVYAYYLDKETK